MAAHGEGSARLLLNRERLGRECDVRRKDAAVVIDSSAIGVLGLQVEDLPAADRERVPEDLLSDRAASLCALPKRSVEGQQHVRGDMLSASTSVSGTRSIEARSTRLSSYLHTSTERTQSARSGVEERRSAPSRGGGDRCEGE